MIPLSKLLQSKGALLLSLLLAGAVFVAFLPARHNGFVNFDDPVYVYANPHVTTGLSWPNVRWAFGALDGGNWHPLTWLSIMLDCELFGPNAGDHHLTSVLLHTASTVLLFLLLRRLTASLWRGALVAALFGLHPLHVESVVWASERKDVLSAFFFMLTLLAYSEYAAKREDRGGRMENGGAMEEGPNAQTQPAPRSTLHAPHPTLWYALALFSFTLGLMSKSMLVTTPVVLLLLDFWPLRRWNVTRQPAEAPNPGSTSNAPRSTLHAPRSTPSAFSLLLEKLPFLLLAVVVAGVTLLAQKHLGAIASATDLPVLLRVGNAVLSYGQYLFQTVWPVSLAVFYPFPKSSALTVLAVLAVLVAGGLLSRAVWRHRRQRPYLLVGWLWYLVTLLPVIGLLQVGSQAHGDRYTYLPLIGVFLAFAWALPDLRPAAGNVGPGHGREDAARPSDPNGANPADAPSRSTLPAPRSAFSVPPLSSILVLAFLLACALLTMRQIGYWKNSIILWRHAAAVTTDNYVAHGTLGALLDKQGRLPEAIAEYQESLRVAPRQAEVRVRLGVAFASQGQVNDAIRQFLQAVKLQPDNLDAHYNLGVGLLSKRHYDEAIHEFQEALRIHPGYPRAESNIRAALAAKAQTAKPAGTPPRP